jgi:hypothetical protein
MYKNSHYFAVRVNGRQAHEYRSLKVGNSNTYIEGRRGSTYTLDYTNPTPNRVLIVPSVDGLSVMDGKPASDQSRGYVVSPYGSISIPGWRIDGGKVAQFEFRPASDRDSPTYVDQLKDAGFAVDATNKGVIGLMVFNEKYPNIYSYLNAPNVSSARGICASPVYPGNPYLDVTGRFAPSLTGGLHTTMSAVNMVTNTMAGSIGSGTTEVKTAAAAIGTGFGQEQNFQTHSIDFDRAVRPLEILVIHYDTLQALRRNGVEVDLPKTEVQSAFPGYNDGCYVPR